MILYLRENGEWKQFEKDSLADFAGEFAKRNINIGDGDGYGYGYGDG